MGKIYPEELKKKGVELYRLDEKTTYAQVGRDLGVSGETVRNWVLCRRRHKTHYADLRIMPTWGWGWSLTGG